MRKKYIEFKSESITTGKEIEDGVWEVKGSLREHRKPKGGKLESKGIEITVYDATFQGAQALALSYLMDAVIEASKNAGVENPSLFDLDIGNDLSD